MNDSDRIYELINWYGHEPEYFACTVCQVDRAMVIRHVHVSNNTMFDLPICLECNNLNDEELLQAELKA